MRVVLILTAAWSTIAAPTLCRIGALTLCCAQAPPSDNSLRLDHCCPLAGEDAAKPVAQLPDRECQSCANLCGPVTKPAEGADRTVGWLWDCQPAALFFVGNAATEAPAPAHDLGCLSAARVFLARPSSDFPLLL